MFSSRFPVKQILIFAVLSFFCQRRQRGGCHRARTLSRREATCGQAGGGFDCLACARKEPLCWIKSGRPSGGSTSVPTNGINVQTAFDGTNRPRCFQFASRCRRCRTRTWFTKRQPIFRTRRARFTTAEFFLNAPPKVAGPFADKKASQDTGGQQPKRADRVKPMVNRP